MRLSELLEGRAGRVTDASGHSFAYLHNPNGAQLSAMIASAPYHHLKALASDSSLYAWPADYMSHEPFGEFARVPSGHEIAWFGVENGKIAVQGVSPQHLKKLRAYASVKEALRGAKFDKPVRFFVRKRGNTWQVVDTADGGRVVIARPNQENANDFAELYNSDPSRAPKGSV